MHNSLLLSLIKKFKEQDMNAFTIIYDEFKKLILLYSTKIQDEDATQELTLFLIELLYNIDISKFKNDFSDSLKRYIAVSIRNKYISLSKQKVKYINQTSELFEDIFLTEQPFCEKLDIYRALSKLTYKQKTVIIYRYIYCYSDAEIAKLFSISIPAVNRLKNRALETLKEYYFEKD